MRVSAASAALRLSAALILASGTYAISNVTRAGRYLYTGDGSRFYIKGVAYQEQGVVVSSGNDFLEPSTFTDPLANSTTCTRDLPYLQQLGVNTIRVYSVNSSLDHDDCMNMLSNANIYTIIDLTLPLNGSIDRTSPSWATNLMDQYIATIDTFSKYDNVLAYNVGNEVVTLPNNTDTAAFVKAAARDIKAYLSSKSSSVLVGYASIDGDVSFRNPVAAYLACDPSNSNSGSTAIDLYGLNNYEWCGDSSFDAAYAGTHADFAGYNIPAYFSEFGCLNSGGSRPFSEVASLLSSQMSDEWSGGIAFSYFPAASSDGQFGMVTISSDGSSVTTSQDFSNLAQQYNSSSPPNTPSQSDAGSTSYPSCPSQNSTFMASTTLPPTPNLSACDCLESALSCQFTPDTDNTTSILGALLDYACSELGQSGGSCDEISGNGTSGTYGLVQGCDPSVKLAWAMSEYYELTGKNDQACSFGGNGTISSASSASATAAATSCLAGATGVSTPTAPATASGGSSSSSGGSSSSSSSSNGAVSLTGTVGSLFGLEIAVVISAVAGLWTVA